MRLENALDYLSGRCEEAEIFFLGQESQSVELERGEVRLSQSGSLSGYGVRVISGQRQGFAHSSLLSRDLLDMALKAARVAKADGNLCLPQPGQYPRVKGTFDPRIKSLGPEEARDHLSSMVSKAREREVSITAGALSWESFRFSIHNTLGVEVRDQGTEMDAYMSTVAGGGENVSSGIYFDTSRSLDLNFEEIAGEASRLAAESLRAQRLEDRKYSLLLTPLAATELLESVLLPAFSADNVQRQRSLLYGKEGEEVFPGLSFEDHGTLDGGLMTSRSDGEGKAMERKSLVEKGVLKGFLHSCYTARKEGGESNGSAHRPSYSTLPRIAPSNFVLSGRESSDRYAQLEVNGIIGAHTSNPISGDFSVEVRNPFLEGSPVKKAIISGNVYQVMEKVRALGRDYHQYSSLVTPSMVLEDVRVVG